MATINLNLDSSALKVNKNNELDVVISPDSGNTLQLYDGGLYAAAPKGDNGTSGKGYIGPHTTDNCTNIGCVSPFESTESSNKYSIKCSLIVHRTWIYDGRDDNNIVKLKGFRSNVDYVMPGDIMKDGNKYYIITQVSTTDSLGTYGMKPGNHVTSFTAMN